MAHYVTPQQLLAAIRAYQLDPVTNHEEIGSLLLLMADRIWGMFPTAEYLYCRDDAMQAGVVNALVKLPLFDERRGNAFNYVTGSIRFGIMQHIKKEYRIKRYMARYMAYHLPRYRQELQELHVGESVDNDR